MFNTDYVDSLEGEFREKIINMFRGCEEVIGVEHVNNVLSGKPNHSGNGQLNAYIGLEPSGKAHLGWVILADTMKNMLNEGVNITILLADWHAWVNDKFGRDMEKISIAADYMSEVFRVLLNHPKEGSGPGQIKFIRA
ncbi:MAG: tyrosyl-tRNA synthetase, partial [Candidatus Thalassarchaeaceae archaeon]